MKYDSIYKNAKFNILVLLSMLTYRFQHRLIMPFSMSLPRCQYDINTLPPNSTKITGSTVLHRPQYFKKMYEHDFIISVQAPFQERDPLGYKGGMFSLTFEVADFGKTTEQLFDEIAAIIDNQTVESLASPDYRHFKADKE